MMGPDHLTFGEFERKQASVRLRLVPSEPSPPTDRTRILIAGDDRRFSERLRASIEAHEALQVVGIAATGDEALHLVETLKPSLVLMEVAIPGLDGIEATRRMHGLRSEERRVGKEC